MNNQALRDKLFAALRGDALPHLRELDDIVLADIDRIMPIVEAHLEAEKKVLAEVFGFYPTADALYVRSDRVDILDMSDWAKLRLRDAC